jgi:hypothetical protein
MSKCGTYSRSERLMLLFSVSKYYTTDVDVHHARALTRFRCAASEFTFKRVEKIHRNSEQRRSTWNLSRHNMILCFLKKTGVFCLLNTFPALLRAASTLRTLFELLVTCHVQYSRIGVVCWLLQCFFLNCLGPLHFDLKSVLHFRSSKLF